MGYYNRVLDGKIRACTEIAEHQFGFQRGKSTTDAIFILRQIIEKRMEGNERVYCAFVDLEKAYDTVP